MDQYLALLGYSSMTEVTSENLKQAFKDAVISSHPDRGGQDGDFDAVVIAYSAISGVLKRMTGGRNGLTVLHPDDVRQQRDTQFIEELNNMVSNIFDSCDQSSFDAFNKEFNEQFERLRQEEPDATGYGDWLREQNETALKDGRYGTATLKEKPNFAEDELNAVFEAKAGQGKPMGNELMLHPDQMALSSGLMQGSSLITKAGTSYTAAPHYRPGFTDLHDAYTNENTVFDKIPVFEDKKRTFDDLLAERGTVYQTELDRDLAAIAAYEKQQQEEEKEHKKSIAEYFKKTASSQWALPTFIQKSKYAEDEDDDDPFIKKL